MKKILCWVTVIALIFCGCNSQKKEMERQDKIYNDYVEFYETHFALFNKIKDYYIEHDINYSFYNNENGISFEDDLAGDFLFENIEFRSWLNTYFLVANQGRNFHGIFIENQENSQSETIIFKFSVKMYTEGFFDFTYSEEDIKMEDFSTVKDLGDNWYLLGYARFG